MRYSIETLTPQGRPSGPNLRGAYAAAVKVDICNRDGLFDLYVNGKLLARSLLRWSAVRAALWRYQVAAVPGFTERFASARRDNRETHRGRGRRYVVCWELPGNFIQKSYATYSKRQARRICVRETARTGGRERWWFEKVK